LKYHAESVLEVIAMKTVHVEGKNVGQITLYALSTCGWCKKTKELLKKLNVAYDYVDMDLLAGKERDDMRKEVEKWNPKCSFPTLVINSQSCIVGFNEDEIKAALKL
jgi:glutaredoxin